MTFLFTNLLNEGGPIYMYPNVILLLTCIILIFLAFKKSEKSNTFIDLVKHLSLFSLVWGFLGFFMGMILSFDSIAMAGDINPSVLADGLKVALLAPSFGMVVFLISRLGIIALSLKSK